MLRAGIHNDWRLLRYHFWHSVMRAAWYADRKACKLHRYAYAKAKQYSPFED